MTYVEILRERVSRREVSRAWAIMWLNGHGMNKDIAARLMGGV